ncbi:MAG: hypothetical protein IKG85_07265 [Clostridia bacterium]|nr:hypothetical protein [Clostridia bacterium]
MEKDFETADINKESVNAQNNYETNSLAEHYNEALKELGSENSVELFSSQKEAKRFIRKRFAKEYTNKKIKECIDLITPSRAIHTVSAFLLGLSIRDNLQIDTRSWRRLPGEHSPKGSFVLFWSLICLFHDIGYKYENDSANKTEYKSIDDWILSHNLNYNLLYESKNEELIRNYYQYRITGKDPCLDHGIIGALLLYDALMDLAESSQIYSHIRYYKDFFVKVCDTIALHNMWRATPATNNVYIMHNLWPLIPGNDQHHIIFYKDDSLLFLLALVDTIDPIKKFCHDRRSKNPATEISVLTNAYVYFTNRNKIKALDLFYNNPDFEGYATQLADTEGGLMSWLGVWVQFSVKNKEKKTISIVIDQKGSKENSRELNS